MTYATQQDLVDSIGEAALVDLTDREVPPSGVVDADVVAGVLADAEAIIDAHLRVRYALPLAAVPPVVRGIATDLAVYRLHRYEVPELVDQRHQDATRTLESIAAGKILLPVADGSEAPSAPSEAVVQAPDRRLNRDTLRDF